MKNNLFTFFLLVFFFGCSTNNDSNGNSTTTVVPIAPSSLIGTVVSTTQINLSWTDNSTNETGFKIERKTGTGTYAFVGTTAVDITTYNDTGLTPNTTYSYRVYSNNAVGNSLTYSNELSLTTTSSTSVTDVDGNMYQLVTICNQTWMQSNLNVSHYRNGDVIPQVSDAIQWTNLTTGAWCYYANTSFNGTTYGKLYNWYAVNDSRGLAPLGYHIPSDTEWTSLTTCLGDPTSAGGTMKEIGTLHWTSPNIAATNSSGFKGLPTGMRGMSGAYYSINTNCYFWSSTEYGPSGAWFRSLNYDNGNLTKNGTSEANGFSVRCIKD
jgi:uncharacterized protein (TIGR02145 family)